MFHVKTLKKFTHEKILDGIVNGTVFLFNKKILKSVIINFIILL